MAAFNNTHQNNDCCGKDAWKAYLSGRVSELELNQMSEHLEQCTRCLEVVDELTLASQKPLPPNLRVYIDEPECEQLLELVKQIRVVPADEPVPEQLGRFLVRRVLGVGGFGRVLLGDDPLLQRLVAIKVPRGQWLSQHVMTLYRDEARRAAALDHPNIVPIYDVLADDQQRLAIVMKFIDGQTLSVLKRQALTPDVAVSLMERIALAVDYAHDRGLIHRDLKPANILVDADGTPFVADFGLSIQQSESGTSVGGGTLPYMSPEQVTHDQEAVGRASDIWALGVILAELIHGMRPFDRTERSEMVTAITTDEPRLGTAPQFEDLNRLIQRCLVKSPQGRWPTAKALAHELARWRRRHYPQGWQRWLHGWRRNTLAVVALTSLTLGLGWQRAEAKRDGVRLLWTQLETAPAAQIPLLVSRLQESRALSMELQPQRATDPAGQWRWDVARLALATAEPTAAERQQLAAIHARFNQAVAQASYDEIANAVRVLQASTQRTELITAALTALRPVAATTEPSPSSDQHDSIDDAMRLKWAALIAGLDPDAFERAKISDDVARWLLVGNEWDVTSRLPLFDRVGAIHLFGGLRASLNSKGLPRSIQNHAALALSHFLANDVARLADLITEADGPEIAILLKPLQAQSKLAVPQLKELFEREFLLPRPVPTMDAAGPQDAELAASRLAVALWMLDEPTAARRAVKADPNPTLQTLVIHELSGQSLVIESVVNLLREVQDKDDVDSVAVKFSLLQVLGLLPSDRVRGQLDVEWLRTIAQRDPDSGVHGAAVWLLKKLEAPYEPTSTAGTSKKRWIETRIGSHWHSFAVIEPHTAELGIHDLNDIPALSGAWPRHRRRFERRIAMSMHEVTIDQLKEFAGSAMPSDKIVKDSPGNGAMTRLSLELMYGYCNWCSEKSGLNPCYEPYQDGNGLLRLVPKVNHLNLDGYRLPTDAEWESACRAATDTALYFGNVSDFISQYGWVIESTQSKRSLNGDPQTQAVGGLIPNRWGLFDMYGNVVEICHVSHDPSMSQEVTDDWDANHTPPIECRSYQGDNTNGDEDLLQCGPVLRGGSLEFQAERFALSHARTQRIRFTTIHAAGFRMARTLLKGVDVR